MTWCRLPAGACRTRPLPPRQYARGWLGGVAGAGCCVLLGGYPPAAMHRCPVAWWEGHSLPRGREPPPAGTRVR